MKIEVDEDEDNVTENLKTKNYKFSIINYLIQNNGNEKTQTHTRQCDFFCFKFIRSLVTANLYMFHMKIEQNVLYLLLYFF